MVPMWAMAKKRIPLLVGVDEAGRGPWAGPVVAAAVYFTGPIPEGVADSKKLSAKRREALVEPIKAVSSWAIGSATAEEIDRINILQATFLAMARAVAGLGALPADVRVLIDGNRVPALVSVAPDQVEAIVKGDATVAQISAASILAKVYRDQAMADMDRVHPGYGFAVHSGYGVPAHQEALRLLGPSPIHRKTFAPIRALLTQHM